MPVFYFMAEYRKELPPLPHRMKHLPLSSKGYPIPYFVGYVNGEADFRVIDPEKVKKCIQLHQCWLCGQTLGQYQAFVVGPMCTINRISAEPPSHRECAEYAVQACPFLVHPHAVRREANLPENLKEPAGVMNLRNPGAMGIWITREWRVVPAPRGSGEGFLIRMGTPIEVEWWAEGQPATREQVEASFWSGYGILMDMAKQDGPQAIAKLTVMTDAAIHLLPK